jgi:hypothetical protein
MGMQYVGIYNADGTILGEIAYVLAKYTGRGHCELCDITHGAVRRKPAWDDACARAGVHVDLRHRDEVTEEQLSVAGELPAVIGFRDGQWVRVMGPDELGACNGDPDQFVTRLLA